jgi:hypothetical protein
MTPMKNATAMVARISAVRRFSLRSALSGRIVLAILT